MTVRDTKQCAVAGELSDGSICTHTIDDARDTMDFDAFVSFLEEKHAICQSAEDWNETKTELELMCRILGWRCRYAAKRPSPTPSPTP